jgi:DNA-binding MarR family transcriptional regulator
LKPLIRDGLVELLDDADDARVRRPALTGLGHARLSAALPLWTAAHAALEAELGDVGPDALRRGLKTLAGLPETAPDPALCAT